jgi:molybdopterin converting factor small subunit
MVVRVRLGSGLSALAGRARLSVEVPENATVTDLIACIERDHPPLAVGLGNVLAVAEGSQLSRDRLLPDDQEVALLMPAAGG